MGGGEDMSDEPKPRTKWGGGGMSDLDTSDKQFANTCEEKFQDQKSDPVNGKTQVKNQQINY